MIECIHGLDLALCDLCAPRKKVDPQDAPVAPRRRVASRKPASLRSSPTSPAVPTSTGPDFSTLRVHHWTHVSNLARILADGKLVAGSAPELDVSSTATRDRRADVTVPSGATVSEHVSFALSPHASTWDEVRTGADGEAWSDAARKTRATDYVVLVIPVTALPDELVVVDVDSSQAVARFGTGHEEGGSLVRRASLADPFLLEVEVLVPVSVDLEHVSLIGVPNDKMRDQVKTLLQAAGGVSPRIAIYPPWFRPTEID